MKRRALCTCLLLAGFVAGIGLWKAAGARIFHDLFPELEPTGCGGLSGQS
jgi:hypothetical protein